MSRIIDALQTLNILRLAKRIQAMEERMASTDEIVSRLRVATDRLAAKIRDLTAGDEAIAEKFRPIVEELEAMGTDTTNPIPEPA